MVESTQTTAMDTSDDRKQVRVSDYSKNWEDPENGKFQTSTVSELYNAFDANIIKQLELSRYLENYLWPNFTPDQATKQQHQHQMIFSILCMVNEKARQNIPIWDCFRYDQPKFDSFFQLLLPFAYNQSELTLKEKITFITFLQNAFQSLEVDMINKHVIRLVSLPMWDKVNKNARNKALNQSTKLLKQWRAFEKKSAAESNGTPKKRKSSSGKAVESPNDTQGAFYHEKNFLWSLLEYFKQFLAKVNEKSEGLEILYCEKFVDWIKDLLAQLPTRRFLRLVLQSTFFLSEVRMSNLYKTERGRLFSILADELYGYYFFEIEDFSGVTYTRDEIVEQHYERIQSLQVIAYKFFSPTLRPFSLRNVGSIEERRSLRSNLSLLQSEELHKLAQHVGLIDEDQKIEDEILLDGIILMHEKRPSKIEQLTETQVYPNEDILWASEPTSEVRCYGIYCRTLPKLNLQFLSFYDYLSRNFTLYQLETAHEIRTNIEDVVQRLTPRLSDDRSKTIFLGWARMSSPIANFNMIQVQKPNLGETVPSSVTAAVAIHLVSMRPEIKEEWKQLQKNDILFLVKIRSPVPRDGTPDLSKPFPEAFGIEAVRGCQIIEVLDSKGKVVGREITDEEIEEKQKKKKEKQRNWHWQRFREKIPVEDVTMEKRTFHISLDPHQYYNDLKNDRDELYEPQEANASFNILIRRNAKQNTFKGVLETIRSMMSEDNHLVPEWFQNVFLGYGDPTESSIPLQESTQWNWNDTFLDLDHLRQSFPSYNVQLDNPNNFPVQPPFIGEISETKKTMKISPAPVADKDQFVPLESFKQPKLNQLRFTPIQSQALFSGMKEGLSVIVGPPGTGKTDVAVQLIHLWYKNFPEQRTLLLTHSNQALNQLFEKLMHLDISESHLLRLGHGESELALIQNPHGAEKNFQFNQVGRVDYILLRRMLLLKKVEALANSLSALPDVAYSCETADLFYRNIITSSWNRFNNSCLEDTAEDSIAVHFPFSDFFLQEMKASGKETKNNSLFSKTSREDDLKTAEKYFSCIKKIFQELETIRPFEILRTTHDRTNYLLMKQAKIIAMTCTHAALRRNDLVALGFNVDNVIMEEAAQVLDIETLIPILSRKQTSVHSDHALRRLVLLGDHHQLPPIIQNSTLQSYSHFDQSMFARFVRLGVPTITLDQQGRSRPSLAKLYQWRYSTLRDLPHISTDSRFSLANPGFAYDYQFIEVGDYNGQGEHAPLPHFYQNLGEAEYMVAVYQFMRLIGYPASSISMITTYNGQKELLTDVVRARCGNNFFGFPAKITTVDHFQGQQNDYILFSMVRTKHVGHIRDVRRLIVAMSRARLGLYVFGRSALYSPCQELQPVFSQLLARPTTLQILPAESFPTTRKVSETPTACVSISEMNYLTEITKNMAKSRLSTLQK